MQTPNLFLIGAQKGGSSTLFDYLIGHPDITGMGRKELNIFDAADAEAAQRRLATTTVVHPDRRYRLDASVNYTRYPKFAKTPENICDICGKDIRFVYIIRNPVERLISNYFWTRERYGGVADLATAMRLDPQMIETSRYDLQLARFFDVFDRDRFWITTMETLYRDPPSAMNDLFCWLELPEQPHITVRPARGATRKGMTREPRFGALIAAARSQGWLRETVRRALPERSIRRLTWAMSVERPRVEPDRAEKKALMETYFSESVRRTAALTGLDLKEWLTAYD